MNSYAFIPLLLATAVFAGCCHRTAIRQDEPAAAAPAVEQATAQEPAASTAPAPATAPDASPVPAQSQESAATAVTTMSPAEIRSLVEVTIDENDGLRKVIADMSGNAAPVISIDREPDTLYPYYDVYIGAQSGDHGWRLFTFIVDPRTKTLKVECTDVTGFDKGTIDEFVGAYNACEDINPAK